VLVIVIMHVNCAFVFRCPCREYPAEHAEKSEVDEPIDGKYLPNKSSTLTCFSGIYTDVMSHSALCIYYGIWHTLK